MVVVLPFSFICLAPPPYIPDVSDGWDQGCLIILLVVLQKGKNNGLAFVFFFASIHQI